MAVLENTLSESMPENAARHGPVFTGIPWRMKFVSSLFMLSDYFCCLSAYILAAWIYPLSIFSGIRFRSLYLWNPWILVLLGAIMGVVLLIILAGEGLYTRGASILNVEEDMMLLRGLLYSAMIAFSASYAFRDSSIPRIALVMAVCLQAPLTVIGRRGVRKISNWFAATGLGAYPVVIYGAGETGRQLADRITRNPQLGLRPVGFLDDRSGELDGWVKFGPGGRQRLALLGGGDQLGGVLAAQNVRHLFLAMPRLSTERLFALQDFCRQQGISCYYVPLFTTGPFRRLSLTFVGDLPLVSERLPPNSIYRRVTKCFFDRISALILLLLFSPLLTLIALAIKLTSRGPVIFRQERIGLKGQPFVMYKFRSMRTEAPAYASKDTVAKSQIFPLGKLLRRTSLDELPQLFNVFKGEMSLVGPRPDMPQIVAAYNSVQRERLIVTPGITGLWQVSADRNNPIHENMDYDLYYIYNQSFLLDLVILIRTAFCLFTGR